MTENETKGLSLLTRRILPKLQEIMRDMILNKHFSVEISTGNYKYGISVCIYVEDDVEILSQDNTICIKVFRFRTYSFRGDEKCYDKTLRGINHFISNWMERLSA